LRRRKSVEVVWPRTRIVLPVALLAAVVALVTWALVGRGGRSTLTVTIGGQTAHVADGMTLSEAVSTFGLHAKAGDLLDVDGNVLRPAAIPPALLLDGRMTPGRTRLRGGDRLDVANARDRREPVSLRVVRAPGGIPNDPQFILARTPGRQVVIEGALSHRLASVSFHPSGKRPTVERAVALTFDDGPSPRYTPAILSTLRRLHVPATFFVVGYLAELYPGLVRRELHAAMAIGNHSYNHPEVPPFDQLPQRLMEDEIALGNHSLSRIGIEPRLFRPPGGSWSAAVVRTAELSGQRVVLWSVDPTDWQTGVNARQIVQRVLTAVRPGSIVILHDGGGDRSATVAALPGIVKGIRRKGLDLVAIPAR
jgi:peptidoglycan/xylan/chitin deacetylase (PgdA/CDA1 family)